MNLTGFNDEQKQTLLDLLVMGMYADGRLGNAEDAKIEAVLKVINFSSDSARDQFVDASFTRARQHLDSPDATREFVSGIARHFPTTDIRRKAYNDLEELVSTEHQAGEKENRLLAIVREEFKL
jgi:uncharacterized tellurite resistance protein B-like protein